MLIFNKAITLRLPSLFVWNHLDLFDHAIRLKLAPELGLAGVVVDPADVQGLEGVGGGNFVGVGIPEGNLLLQLVGNLFIFFSLLAFQSVTK